MIKVNRIVTAAVVGFLMLGAAMAQEKGAAAKRVPSPKAVTGVVNLNTATVAELELLPKVGPAMARRIVELREKGGAFKRTEELLNVKGVGEKGFAALKPYLTLTGPTTIKAVATSAKK